MAQFPHELITYGGNPPACAAALGAPLAARNDVLTVVPAPLDEATLRARLIGAEAAAPLMAGALGALAAWAWILAYRRGVRDG